MLKKLIVLALSVHAVKLSRSNINDPLEMPKCDGTNGQEEIDCKKPLPICNGKNGESGKIDGCRHKTTVAESLV